MAHPLFFDHILEAAQHLALQATQNELAPEIWWLPALVLLVLGISATVDALTGTIPDWLILLGLASVVTTQGFTMGWPFAMWHLRPAITAGVALWFLNWLWRKQFKSNVYGMGDTKWTMLAVSCFGFLPALFAWGTAACLAAAWIGGARLAKYKNEDVYFGPFLFIGLLVGLYWLRLK